MNYDNRNTMRSLEGRTILGYTLSDGKHHLSILTDQGPVNYRVYGDCCSHSWFEYVDELDSVIGGKVLETREIPMAEVEAQACERERVSEQETLRKLSGEEERDLDVVLYYGHEIITDKGHAKVEFRNSSNGYYGGEMIEVSS